jgi:translation initiation factor 1
MGRLLAGTPWDRPPTCERCGQLESACQCAPVEKRPELIPPEKQTARLRVEKRARGKVVTLVVGLDPDGNDLTALATILKGKCGSGGTVKEGLIEVQGEHLDAIEKALTAIGYKTRRG